MARRRGKKIRVYVENKGLKYGFQTQKDIHTAHKEKLGQTTYAGATGVVFGANSPKPATATKDFANGVNSSFCSSNKIDTLRADGWTVTNKGSFRGISGTGKTKTVCIDMPGGWLYAWNITSAEADLAADLGFRLATAADASNLVWGVNYPKPPRATKRENGSSTSSFISPKQSQIEKAIAAGYSVSAVDYDLIPGE